MNKEQILNGVETLIETQVEEKLKSGKKYLEECVDATKNNIDSHKEWFPQTNELTLRHLDILLETSKDFLIIFSSAFVGSIALKSETISNIDLNLIRWISLGVVIIASISMLCILKTREKVLKEIMNQYLQIRKLRSEVNKTHREIIDLISPRNIDETKKEIIETLKKI